uniref:Uncharacterized protein n=1 Tax=Physcomitrium patens TaxID=3218 RepID=A0A2K1IGA4_PHYPA|nr:hypothetical protein PHYPA_028896 [Physcomitrium patens]
MSCSPRWQMLRCQPTPSVSFPIWGGIIWMLWGVGIQFLSTHCLVVLLHFSKPHQTSKR